MGLHKKVIKAYKQGVDDAIRDIEEVMEQTKGIGPELASRFKAAMKEYAAKKVKEREANGTLGEIEVNYIKQEKRKFAGE